MLQATFLLPDRVHMLRSSANLLRAAAEAAHTADVAQLKEKHAAEIDAAEEEHQEVLERDSQSHGRALSECPTDTPSARADAYFRSPNISSEMGARGAALTSCVMQWIAPL